MGLAWILEYVAAAYFCCYWHGTVHAVIFRLLCSYMYRLIQLEWFLSVLPSSLPNFLFPPSFLSPSLPPPRHFSLSLLPPSPSFPLLPSSPPSLPPSLRLFPLPPYLSFSLSPLIFLSLSSSLLSFFSLPSSRSYPS